MIGKIAKAGSSFGGCLNYCIYEKKTSRDLTNEAPMRGEYIWSQHLVTLERKNPMQANFHKVVREFDRVSQLNARTVKPVLHQTFSFPIGEKPENRILEAIAKDFAKEFGLEDNQLVVFKHHDTKHDHIHIVANRLNVYGRKTYREGNNFYKLGNFCRKMEVKYKLVKVQNMHANRIDGKLKPTRNALKDTLIQIIDTKLKLGQIQDLKQLADLLVREGWKMNLGRGVSFTHKKTGETWKGSELGRGYSKSQLEGSIVGNQPNVEPVQEIETIHLKRAIRQAVSQSSSINQFSSLLLNEGYGVHIRTFLTNQGRKKKTISFSKRYGRNGTQKFISGSELGIPYRIDHLDKTLRFNEKSGERKWREPEFFSSPSNQKVSLKDRRKSENPIESGDSIHRSSPTLSPLPLLHLDQLLTSHNASAVHQDSGKSSGMNQVHRDQAGPRGDQEIKQELIRNKKLSGGKRRWHRR